MHIFPKRLFMKVISVSGPELLRWKRGDDSVLDDDDAPSAERVSEAKRKLKRTSILDLDTVMPAEEEEKELKTSAEAVKGENNKDAGPERVIWPDEKENREFVVFTHADRC